MYVFIRHKITREKENIGTNSDLSWNRGKGKEEKPCPQITRSPSSRRALIWPFFFKLEKEEAKKEERKSLRLVTHTPECMTFEKRISYHSPPSTLFTASIAPAQPRT